MTIDGVAAASKFKWTYSCPSKPHLYYILVLETGGRGGKQSLPSTAGGQMNRCSFHLTLDLPLLLLNLLQICRHMNCDWIETCAKISPLLIEQLIGMRTGVV